MIRKTQADLSNLTHYVYDWVLSEVATTLKLGTLIVGTLIFGTFKVEAFKVETLKVEAFKDETGDTLIFSET